MRDPDRILVILGALREYWLNHPDLRLCQLISNITRGTLPDGVTYGDLYNLEDDTFMREFEAYKKLCETANVSEQGPVRVTGTKNTGPGSNDNT